MFRTSDFHYDLPERLIATEPPKKRGDARLLVLNNRTGNYRDMHYRDVGTFLHPGDVLVLNDTKVLPARLMTKKRSSGVRRELILLEKHGTVDDWHLHRVLYRKRLSEGDRLIADDGTELMVKGIEAGGVALIESPVDLLELSVRVGEVPLPPYMHREATEADRERYQTVWAKHLGSVAAPTASLNMTGDLLAQLQAQGIEICYLTLHVGMGTFLPIRTDDLSTHRMHEEYFEIPKQTVASLQRARKERKQIVALGTTVTRTLEYAASELFESPPQDLHGEADIFMYPGYKFKAVDALLTNFHAPQSTVLMLAAAFATWPFLKAAYDHATTSGYRFLSYGDSMFITKESV